MKALLIATSAALMVAACSTSGGMDEVAPAMNPNSLTSAPGYMAMAASSDMFEIESSRLALQMSQNPQVRQFAEMMIADHTRTSAEMMGIAQTLGLQPPPPMMNPHHQEMLNRLRAAQGGQFESAYKREQILAHQEALNLHQAFAARGDSEPLRAFASRVVPAIQMHYQHAQMLPEGMSMQQPMMQQPMQSAPARSGERG